MKRFLLFLLAFLAVAVRPSSAAPKTPLRYSRHIVIAASNTDPQDKKLADFVCTGKNDERVINKAIEKLKYGGTIQLLDGDYNIDAFEQDGNSAIYFGFNDGNARTISLVGTTENKSYNTRFGVTLHVTEKAFSTMNDKEVYRVFYGTAQKPEYEGVFFKYTYINNVNFENFYLYFFNAQKKLIGIDCRRFGNSDIRQVGVYTESYFEDRFLHRKPATPVEGCIGICTTKGANDEMSRLGLDTVSAGGLYAGFCFCGVEHLVMKQCTTARCVIGYLFDRGGHKTLTMINCCDEGNTHLPVFNGSGQITMIDFNIERLSAKNIPDDPTGNEEHHAYEKKPGGWHGFISYTMGGRAFGLTSFWAEGSGKNFKTIDLKTEAATWDL